jgi:hypothetical protein
MVTKFIGRLDQTQFYGTLILFHLFGGMATGRVIEGIDFMKIVPTFLPISLLIIPFVFVRKKTNPEEFIHLPKNRFILIVISYFVLSIGGTLLWNLK